MSVGTMRCALSHILRSNTTRRGIPSSLPLSTGARAAPSATDAAAAHLRYRVNLPTTQISTLANGMRIVTENWNTPTATVGVFVNVGSRYETESTNGVAHFLEHMAFKGTKKRRQHDIELEVENRGAHLNAYTSREMTVYYAKCFSQHAPWAVDLISDLLLHSEYDEQQMQRERGVILREMQEISTNYQEVVFDELHAGVYKNHPLGWTILGPESIVNSLQRKNLQDFIRTHYRGPEMVLVGTGGIRHQDLHQAAEQYFGKLSSTPRELVRDESLTLNRNSLAKSIFHSGEAARLVEPQIPQAHFALALEGPGWHSSDTLALMVASNICGHWQRSAGLPAMQISRFLPVKCYEGGVVHSYQSFFTCYVDTSLWGIYVVAEGGTGLKQVIADIQQEWKRFASDNVSDEEVERAKNQFCTTLLLQLDGTTPNCEEIGRQMLTYGRRVPTAELLERIMSITPDHLRQVCRKYILGKDLAISSVGPVQDIPDFNEMRQGMK